MNKQTLSFGLLLLLGFTWGTGYTIARFVLTHGVSPLGYSFWLALGPATLLTMLTRLKGLAIPLSLQHGRYYAISALLGVVIPNTNMYFAAPHLPAGLLAVIVNTVPILVYPIALLANAETFNLQRFLGIGCAIAGLMLLILPKASLPSPHMIPWVFAVLATPFSFALCAVYIARFRPGNLNAWAASSGTLIFSTALLLPIMILTHSTYILHLSLTPTDWIILLEIALASVGYIVFFTLIQFAGPVYYSLVDTIVSLTGLFWGYMIFHEQLNHWTRSAVLFILFALLLITKKQRQHQLAIN